MKISEGVDKDSNPYIEIDSHRYFKVGCKDCGTGGRFSLCWDGDFSYLFYCERCGRILAIESLRPGMAREIRKGAESHDMRFF